MKKRLIFGLLIISVLFVSLASCSNLSYSALPYFANFGEPGEIVVTGKAAYLIPGVPAMSRVTVVMNPEGETYGILEGTYTKYLLKKAVSSEEIEINGRSDFDYHYFGFGKTFFSSYDSENMLNTRIKNTKAVIDFEMAARMKKADVAVYAAEPVLSFEDLGVSTERFSLLFITVLNDTLDMEIVMDSMEDAQSFFKLLKNHYFTFKTKLGVPQAQILGMMDATFSKNGDIIRVSNLEDTDYIDFWKAQIMMSGNSKVEN